MFIVFSISKNKKVQNNLEKLKISLRGAVYYIFVYIEQDHYNNFNNININKVIVCEVTNLKYSLFKCGHSG